MISLPDIDELVALVAVLHVRPVFSTRDVADWVRSRQPHTSLAQRSNAEIGRFLSRNQRLLLIQSSGTGGARGHVWRRTIAGNVAALLLWFVERGHFPQMLALLRRLRPAQAAAYARVADRLWSDPKAGSSQGMGPRRRRKAAPAPLDDSGALAWDDSRLAVKSDPALRRRYRLLQSWYRETQLAVPAGRNADGRLVGSVIDFDASLAVPGLNFLDDDIAGYVDERLPEIQATGGTVDPDRLRRNMLSSQPLCFNLFGGLRSAPEAAAEVLSDVFDLDIDVIEELTVEYAPLPAGRYLADRTAFDAFVVYRTHTGERGFVGVETKYTEPFSPRVYRSEDNPRYAHWTSSEHGFRKGAVAKLEHKHVNQLWRNTLLAIALRKLDGFDRGHVAVLGLEADSAIRKAVNALSAQLIAPDAAVQVSSFERLTARAGREDELAAWADAFRRRYLDLAPVSTGP